MTMMTLTCKNCNKVFQRVSYEVNRQERKGNSNHFCCRSCSVQYNNIVLRGRTIIAKTCPVCGNNFMTETGSKESVFCSRSCASRGSLTDKRIKKAKEISNNNFVHSVSGARNTLIKRESWKYIDVEKLLCAFDISYEFEHIVDDYIYDLVLTDKRVLIEFDGPDHNENYDSNKNAIALKNNWLLYRLPVKRNESINSNIIVPIINKFYRKKAYA